MRKGRSPSPETTLWWHQDHRRVDYSAPASSDRAPSPAIPIVTGKSWDELLAILVTPTKQQSCRPSSRQPEPPATNQPPSLSPSYCHWQTTAESHHRRSPLLLENYPESPRQSNQVHKSDQHWVIRPTSPGCLRPWHHFHCAPLTALYKAQTRASVGKVSRHQKSACNIPVRVVKQQQITNFSASVRRARTTTEHA